MRHLILSVLAPVGLVALAACGTGERVPAPDPSAEQQAAPGNATPTQDAGPRANDQAEARRPRSPTGYRLIGTEPFWGGDVSGEAILYTTMEDQQGQQIAVTAAYEDDREIYSGRLRDRPFVLTLSEGPCSDGMSDNVHLFTATLQVDEEMRQGCANPR